MSALAESGLMRKQRQESALTLHYLICSCGAKIEKKLWRQAHLSRGSINSIGAGILWGKKLGSRSSFQRHSIPLKPRLLILDSCPGSDGSLASCNRSQSSHICLSPYARDNLHDLDVGKRVVLIKTCY
jgi:hypothetical protein